MKSIGPKGTAAGFGLAGVLPHLHDLRAVPWDAPARLHERVDVALDDMPELGPARDPGAAEVALAIDDADAVPRRSQLV